MHIYNYAKFLGFLGIILAFPLRREQGWGMLDPRN